VAGKERARLAIEEERIAASNAARRYLARGYAIPGQPLTAEQIENMKALLGGTYDDNS